MIEVQGLTKKYGSTYAVEDLSFTVPAGAITVLAGPNGAGKSTTIKSMAGLLRFKGDILIDQYNNKSIDAKRMLGYIAEAPAMYGMLTVAEHLEFIARAYSLDETWQARAQALLEQFELTDKMDKLGKELSKGMQQKVSICCALLPEPKYLLVDEPMVGLDPHAIKTLKEVFKAQRDRGVAILISTHLLDSVEDLWDRLLILVQGKISITRSHADMEQGGESLSELFFRVTEGEK
ncbi:ABC transporter ATP-binding protein [Christensenellaceae bacterium OttesenSCG-928-M15]|nr:ABC transporter ATP-binding protein [Christensenellaceae bacterium OttesenSCG-928-M15]